MWKKLKLAIRRASDWWNGLPPERKAEIKKQGKRVGDILKDKARKK
jgi:hypothetical protein